MNNPSDLELIAALNRGESAAFEILYERHKQWIVGLAFRFAGNQDDALDVMQETFTYLLDKVPGFLLTSELRTFFYWQQTSCCHL